MTSTLGLGACLALALATIYLMCRALVQFDETAAAQAKLLRAITLQIILASVALVSIAVNIYLFLLKN